MEEGGNGQVAEHVAVSRRFKKSSFQVSLIGEVRHSIHMASHFFAEFLARRVEVDSIEHAVGTWSVREFGKCTHDLALVTRAFQEIENYYTVFTFSAGQECLIQLETLAYEGRLPFAPRSLFTNIKILSEGSSFRRYH